MAVGAQPGVDRAHAGLIANLRRAEQSQRAIRGDRVTRDAARGGVHREQELTVVGDLDPARRRLEIRERRRADRRQGAVGGHAERRDSAIARATVGVRDEQLARIGGTELAAERPRTLRGERRAGRGCQAAVATDAEAVDQRAADSRADEVCAGGVEQHITGLCIVGECHRGAGKRPQPTAAAQGEARVVRAARAGVGHIDETIVLGDADGSCPARRHHAMRDRLQRAVVLDPQDRDLVASCIGRNYVAAVACHLDGALRRQPRSGACAARVERRPGQRR